MTGLTLSPDLDVAGLAQRFASSGRLHIPDVLTPASAEALADALETFDDWRLSVAAGQEFFELPLKDRRAAESWKQSWIDPVRVDGADARMQYLFDTRRLTEDAAPVGDAVDDVLAFLNGAPFLDFVRGVTGDNRIAFADAQATRYRPGHVLTAHDDHAEGKNRLYAYVLNLTRNWRADWGGLLMFPDADGRRVEACVPAFNALNLFRVPMPHLVTQVADFAPRDRLSITGWLRTAG